MKILDGGVASEMDLQLHKKSSDDPTWCACHHILYPNTLKKVHLDFAKSGSQILSANTYSILQYLLKNTDEEIEKSVMIAVDILKKVRELYPKIKIAGCLSAHNCIGYSENEIKKSVTLLASCLKKSSVDYILVEMVQNKHIGKIMVDAASKTNVPIMIGFSLVKEENFITLKKKDTIFSPEVINYILEGVKNVKCVGVMHSDVNIISEALSIIEKVWSGDLIAYPDCGTFTNNVWITDATENRINEIAEKLLDCKMNHPNLYVVGGCCGLGPLFIKKITKLFEKYIEL